MDNRSINVVAEGDEALELAIRLIWSNQAGHKATHYKIEKLRQETRYYGRPDPSWHDDVFVKDDKEGIPTLVLLWKADPSSQPLPYPIGLEEAINFIKGWLSQVEYPVSPAEDDISVDQAWRVFGDEFRKVAGINYGIIGVQPVWALYGR